MGIEYRLTKIMYDVYLSHGLTKEYVRLLIEKDLIEYLDGERTFKTTDTGMNFLRIHNKVQGLTLLTTKSQRREILGDPSTIKKAENCYHQTSGSSTGRQTSEQQQISQH